MSVRKYRNRTVTIIIYITILVLTITALRIYKYIYYNMILTLLILYLFFGKTWVFPSLKWIKFRRSWLKFFLYKYLRSFSSSFLLSLLIHMVSYFILPVFIVRNSDVQLPVRCSHVCIDQCSDLARPPASLPTLPPNMDGDGSLCLQTDTRRWRPAAATAVVQPTSFRSLLYLIFLCVSRKFN